jgi:ABC-type maltose transport system permease subunit
VFPAVGLPVVPWPLYNGALGLLGAEFNTPGAFFVGQSLHYVNGIVFAILYAVLFLQSEDKFTIPISMGTFLTGDDAPWNLLMAISTVFSIPPVIFYYIFRKYLTTGLVSGAVQGT